MEIAVEQKKCKGDDELSLRTALLFSLGKVQCILVAAPIVPSLSVLTDIIMSPVYHITLSGLNYLLQKRIFWTLFEASSKWFGIIASGLRSMPPAKYSGISGAFSICWHTSPSGTAYIDEI